MTGLRTLYKLAQLGVVNHTPTDSDEFERPIPYYPVNQTGRPKITDNDRDYLTRLLLREFPDSINQIQSDQTYSNELFNP